MSKTVHLINEAGDRIEVERKDFSKSELLNEQKYSNYDIDVDWYLNNGYSLAEDMFRRIESNDVENVLNRIFLVGIAYNGQIPPLYTKAQTAILNLDKTVANVYASSIANAPYAWKRDNVLVLVVGNYVFIF